MSLFKVEKVIDGNTIVVNPNWTLGSKSGNEIIVRGFTPMFSKEVSKKWNDADENKLANELAKKRLEFLLIDKFVELKTRPTETSDCIDEEGKGKFRIYLDDVDISYYFPDFN